MGKRVVITGIGILSPVGNDKETYFANLMQGKSGIEKLQTDFVDLLDSKIAGTVKNFNPLCFFEKNKAESLDRSTQFSLVTIKQALTDAKINLEKENLQRVGVFIGTAMGGASTIDNGYYRLLHDKAKRLNPLTILMSMMNASSSQIALNYGFTGPNITFSNACSSSNIAIGEAVNQIKLNNADVMIAGGTESMLTYGTIKAWEALRTLAKEDLIDPSLSSKPFSLNRSGFVLSEGAAMFVLEDLNHAINRGAKIYAEIIGYGNTNDSQHITQPSIEGQVRAMQAALLNAGIDAKDLDYINAHGTGTKLNDSTETKAIRSIGAQNVPTSSTKSMHGHLIGATGAVELVACIMAIKNHSLPPTANLAIPDPDCDLDYVPNKGRANIEVNTVMSNSFAFGGTSAVLVINKF